MVLCDRPRVWHSVLLCLVHPSRTVPLYIHRTAAACITTGLISCNDRVSPITNACKYKVSRCNRMWQLHKCLAAVSMWSSPTKCTLVE